MRAGCDGGGKGALVSNERSLTLAAAGNDQVDSLVNEPELAQTLNCMHDQQAVMCYENHGNDSRITESNEVSPLISSRAGTGGNNLPLVQECYAIDSIASNSMKSSNPNSGFHKEDIAKTIDTTNPNPVKNQGGNVIVESVAIAENIIGRQVQNGGNGIGAQEELAYTQNTSGVTGVANHAIVRRLLPIETERLMGFPDNWTRIPWKGKPEEDCPDSPRYKACGNSMCVNVMRWIGMRIENIERKTEVTI